MTIRKRNDSVKPGCGIDGTEGENFTKRSTSFFKSNPRGNFIDKKGVGAYQDADASFLRNVPANDDPEGGKYTLAGDAVDILDAVEANQSDSGNRGIKPRGGR